MQLPVAVPAKETNQIRTLLRLGDEKIHVVAGDELVGVGAPFVEGFVVPADCGFLERIGIGVGGGGAGRAAVDCLKRGALLVFLECMAARATLFKERLAAGWIG